MEDDAIIPGSDEPSGGHGDNAPGSAVAQAYIGSGMMSASSWWAVAMLTGLVDGNADSPFFGEYFQPALFGTLGFLIYFFSMGYKDATKAGGRVLAWTSPLILLQLLRLRSNGK